MVSGGGLPVAVLVVPWLGRHAGDVVVWRSVLPEVSPA
jgi:hypothetical protein